MTTSEVRLRAVVVAPVASRYLPHTLAALAAQTRPVDEVLIAALGTGRAATSQEWERLVADAGLDRSRVRVVPVPDADTFGSAVRRALAAAQKAEQKADGTPGPGSGPGSSPVSGQEPQWLWLLHDDSAPAPEAAAELLHTVEASRAITVVGCKQVDWDRPERLISVGVRATPGGLRFTGIEDREIDQGQHDGREDVLAVGTAGMLIATELWDLLGGPDAALGPFEDGRDLCQRARLAGHRVVVAPTAVIRHARLSYRGLREDGHRRPDPRRSFRERRRAALHLRLVSAPAPLVPVLAVAAVVVGVVRALWRVSTKELALTVQELLAPLAVLARPGAIARARRHAGRTRRLPRRRLRPLQASWRDVWRLRRDRRLLRAAARRAARTPSELEMAERASVARRRRLALAGVLLLSSALAAVTILPTVLTGPLIGGALLPADADFAGVWHAATSAWIAAGDGQPGPPDPFLLVLGALSLLTGGLWGVPLHTSISLLLVLAVPLAALSAWFAAGAATRSVLVRAWVALTWALGPSLLLGLGAGRVGGVLAHLLLPLVLLGVVRSLGLDRRDVIVSGMVGAQRLPRARVAKGVSAREAKRARLAALAEVGSEEAKAEEVPQRTPRTPRTPRSRPAPEEETPRASVVSRISRAGSLGAAAAAGLAFAVVVAGAPVLLAAAVPAILILAAGLGRRRRLPVGRGRLVLVLVPAVVVMLPLGVHALATTDGWRALLADPGAGLAIDHGPAWLRLLGWPQPPAWEGGVVMDGGAGAYLPLAASGVLVIIALLALLRGAGRSRAVRLGWLLVSLGVVTAELSGRVVVGLGREAGGEIAAVTGWAGPGASLALAGLLIAAASGVDGLRGALSGASFGWRQLGVAVGTLAITLALLTTGLTHGARVVSERDGGLDAQAMLLHDRGAPPVPALAEELQGSEQQARVLALTATGEGVDAQIWRGPGPQLTESSTVAALRQWQQTAGGTSDPAAQELAAVVARLTQGTATEVAETFAGHAISVIVVPATSDVTRAPLDAAARTRLIPLLDSVVGLDRVTENESGVIWRVRTSEESSDADIARAQIRDSGGALVANVSGTDGQIRDTLDAEGTGRTVVLAERSDPSWRAWLGGTALRAVDSGWQQAFSIPDGARGELVLAFRPAWYQPWQILTVVVLALTALLALPTRRRRGEDA
ncbi:glycosyltransferase family 2 protein [Ruania suaedae]|uniref:glycosyltransferase n=1 Tax=Ruania suaedae TaxID=2897774 RepID=UPI001E563ADB|nr:glycosyltransferase [Ruania suaedae]UFU02221.1 glycosyltransferase family 2 protein [Ruania suaedae]